MVVVLLTSSDAALVAFKILAISPFTLNFPASKPRIGSNSFFKTSSHASYGPEYSNSVSTSSPYFKIRALVHSP